MKQKRMAVLFLVTCMLAGCDYNERVGIEETMTEPVTETNDMSAQWKEASTTPFGRYPQTVTYTLAKEITEDNSKLPLGESYEDNAYTRLIREVINAQNQDVYENSGDSYYNGVYMMVTSGEIADVMVVSEEIMYQMQEKGMLEDLTDAYAQCASEKIKEIYESYGGEIFGNCTFGKRIMAVPETNISNGPNLCWVRKDYLDKLGLDIPQTLADVEAVAAAFVEQNVGCTETEPNIGIACNAGLTGSSGTASEFTMDLEFAAFSAYPQMWIEKEDGNVWYGSIQPEARDALLHLHELYENGVLDPDFLIRTQEDIADLIIKGRCGIFFAPWWAPNNPLWKCREVDANADWVPCLIDNTGVNATRFGTQKMTGNYVVVRKGYEHPEIVFKIISVMFDYMRYSYDDPEGEFELYYRQNVDPTARPLSINVDYNQALNICYENLCGVLNGEIPASELELLERSYYQVCEQYLENPQQATAESWSGYASRIAACSLLSEGNIIQQVCLFPRIPSDLMMEWYALEDLEQEVYLRIIRGEVGIEAFDDFVEQWKEKGGTQIEAKLENVKDKQLEE